MTGKFTWPTGDVVDLTGLKLTEATLNGVKLRSEIPIVPSIDAAILAAIEPYDNALDMDHWHFEDYCGTRHCRAGWAITLAGEAGKTLERELGPAAAGALIYAVSRPGKPIPDFYASNEDALADLRACAAES